MHQKNVNFRIVTSKETNQLSSSDSHMTIISKMRHADIARPFTDLVSNLHYSEISTHTRQVLKTLISTERAFAPNDALFEEWRKSPGLIIF